MCLESGKKSGKVRKAYVHITVHGLLHRTVSWIITLEEHVSALDLFVHGSFQPYVCGWLIEIVRYIIYNTVMTLDSCQIFFDIYPALRYKMLSVVSI